jgi:hypothetical protein
VKYQIDGAAACCCCILLELLRGVMPPRGHKQEVRNGRRPPAL